MAKGERIELRVSLEEKERIVARAAEAGLSASEWLRMLGFGEAAVGVSVTDSAGRPAADRVTRVRVDADRAEVVLKASAEDPPFKCPVCPWRTANPKESCPKHQRQPVAG